jgi:hypothetical protein
MNCLFQHISIRLIPKIWNRKNYLSYLRNPSLILTIFLFVSSFRISAANDTTALWIRNYPVISKSLTSVFIKVRLNQPGNVYFVFYDTIKTGIKASKIRSDAKAAGGGEVIKNGIIAYPNITETKTLLVNGFSQDLYCHLYMVPESADSGMLDTDIVSFNFPMKLKHTIVPIGTKSSDYGYLEYLPSCYCVDCIKNFPQIGRASWRERV